MCGARSNRWTPASWVPSARSSRNVNSGGRLGSGKLVLLKGSVSSKNCTRQASVAMMHPCRGGRGPRGQRARRPGRRVAARWGGRSRLADSRARRLRRARLQPGLRPRGAGRGRGRRAPSFPSCSSSSPPQFPVLPAGLPRSTVPAAPTTKGRTTCTVPAALRQGRRPRRTGNAPRADSAVRAPRSPDPSCNPWNPGNWEGDWETGLSSSIFPTWERAQSFQMKATMAGLLLSGFGKAQLGTRRLPASG